MPGQAVVGDMIIGVCDHGSICCPHNVVGVQISGSGDTKVDTKDALREGDLGIHNCPHCGISICASVSTDKKINGLGAHKQGDIDLFPGGVGITVTASDDVLSD